MGYGAIETNKQRSNNERGVDTVMTNTEDSMDLYPVGLLDELQRVASRAIKIAELEKRRVRERRVREDYWYDVVSYILCDLKTAVADLEDAHAAKSPRGRIAGLGEADWNGGKA